MNVDFSSSNKTMEPSKDNLLTWFFGNLLKKEIENEIACDCVGYVL